VQDTKNFYRPLTMNVLVTGGAGYIGSHVTRLLSEARHSVIVLDDLTTGHRQNLIHGEKLIVNQCGNKRLVREIVREFSVEAVFHFAGSIVVPESVADPLKYYANNVSQSVDLIDACLVQPTTVKYFIFSSSAAVYGIPTESKKCIESDPTHPLSPYGTSKLMVERILEDCVTSALLRGQPFDVVSLRYFNVAGADPLARMGQRSPVSTHLIKICCEAALKRRPYVEVFGTDYPTPDGTCIRDFIHIEDLAQAHLLALNFLSKGLPSKEKNPQKEVNALTTLNVGYGRGFSVQEVVSKVQEVSAVPFEVKLAQRRPGDPPFLVADSNALQMKLGFKPQFDSLKKIIEDAWRWEQSL
jgi:UDP-glucose 4-epimerase